MKAGEDSPPSPPLFIKNLYIRKI